MGTNTIKLGNIIPSNEGAWVSTTAYPKYKEVKHNNKLWAATNSMLAGDEPGVAGGWMLVHDFNGISYESNAVFYSDNDGILNKVDLAEGTLKYDDTNKLHFSVVRPPQDSVGIAYMSEDFTNTFGSIFIGTDDNLYSTGISNATITHFSRGTKNSGMYTKVGVAGEKTGTWVKIVFAAHSAFAITSTGELWFIGKNHLNHGFLYGTGTLENIYGAFTKTPLVGVTDVAMSNTLGAEVCALAVCSDGKVYSAGDNDFGQLGLGSAVAPTVLTQVDTSTLNGKAIGVFGGNTHQYGVFAITTDANTDNLYTVGYNAVGELGIGSVGHKNVFTQAVTAGEKVLKFKASGSYSSYVTSIILTASGKIGTTGRSSYGSGGWGSDVSKTSFFYWTCSSSFIDFTIIDSHAGTTVGLTSTGDVWKTGYSGYYLNGDGTATKHTTPVKLQALGVDFGTGKVIKVVGNVDYSQGLLMFLTDAKEVYHTGSVVSYCDGMYGRSGHFINKVPVTDVEDIAVFGDGSNIGVLARTSNSDGIAWGYNGHGECGTGLSNGNIHTPAPILISG